MPSHDPGFMVFGVVGKHLVESSCSLQVTSLGDSDSGFGVKILG